MFIPGRIYRSSNCEYVLVDEVIEDRNAAGGYYVAFTVVGGKPVEGINGRMFEPSHGSDIDYILYMYQGKKEWEGTRKEIIFSKNQRLNDFIFASEFLRDAKDMRMLEETGKIPNDRNMDQMIRP